MSRRKRSRGRRPDRRSRRRHYVSRIARPLIGGLVGRLLPQNGRQTVSAYRRIPRHEGASVLAGSCDDESIGRIRVHGQPFGFEGDLWRDGVCLDARQGQNLARPLANRRTEVDTSPTGEERNLPEDDRRDANAIGIVNGLPRAPAQPGRLEGPPEQGVGIERDHRREAFGRIFQVVSLLEGSKRSATRPTGRPARRPRIRARVALSCSRGSAIGTRRATGRPRFVTTTSTSLSATSSSSARHPCLNWPAAMVFVVMDIVYGHIGRVATKVAASGDFSAQSAFAVASKPALTARAKSASRRKTAPASRGPGSTRTSRRGQRIAARSKAGSAVWLM